MNKHTKGPWEQSKGNPTRIFDEKHTIVIADCYEDKNNEQVSKANARLIASTPELLEVLKKSLTELQVFYNNLGPKQKLAWKDSQLVEILREGKQIIAKAE